MCSLYNACWHVWMLAWLSYISACDELESISISHTSCGFSRLILALLLANPLGITAIYAEPQWPSQIIYRHVGSHGDFTGPTGSRQGHPVPHHPPTPSPVMWQLKPVGVNNSGCWHRSMMGAQGTVCSEKWHKVRYPGRTPSRDG